MRTYETTFIVNPQADDASIDRQVKAIMDIITGNGGEILHEDRIGTRRLAYEVNGLTQGFYASIIHKSGTAVLPILDRHFKLEEPYMRYLTIVYEGDVEQLKGERQEIPDFRGRGPGRHGRDRDDDRGDSRFDRRRGRRDDDDDDDDDRRPHRGRDFRDSRDSRDSRDHRDDRRPQSSRGRSEDNESKGDDDTSNDDEL